MFGEEDVVDVVLAVVFLRCRLVYRPVAVDNKLGNVNCISFMQSTRVGEGAVR